MAGPSWTTHAGGRAHRVRAERGVVGPQAQRDHELELRIAFAALRDDARSGITRARLAQVAHELGLDLSEGDVQLMIAEADRDRDGVVSEAEFMSALRKAMHGQAS